MTAILKSFAVLFCPTFAPPTFAMPRRSDRYDYFVNKDPLTALALAADRVSGPAPIPTTPSSPQQPTSPTPPNAATR